MDLLIPALIIVVVLILFLLAFMLFRTLTFARALSIEEPVEGIPVDAPQVAEHLGAALRFVTISVIDGSSAAGYMPFLDLQNYLQQTYPLVHARLERRRFGDYSLLYTWPGSNPDLAPIVLMAHQDVVPIPSESLPNWTHAPFSGAVADGYVWGRGAQDCKMQLIGILEAAERLLSNNFTPARTIYFAFGHDEEIGGQQGARAIANWFTEQGIHPEAVLDEGGAVVDGLLPGIDTPVGLIGVAEKGFMTLELTVEAAPGHSSTPPRETAIGILAKAIAFIEATPAPIRLDAAEMLFRGVGPVLPFGLQFALANRWLFGGMVGKNLAKNPATNAMIRTTAAPTIIHAGVKENVLPASAIAKINIRLLPGDTIAGSCERVRKIIADERVKFEPMQAFIAAPSPFSRTDTPAYHALARTIRQMFDNVPVAPMLMLGGTDARNYHEICESVYRFIPLVFNSEDMKRVHGTNERVSVEGMARLVQFFAQIMLVWGSPLVDK